nr:DUF2256 domain-containing protein [Vibrio hangzhouensis]
MCMHQKRHLPQKHCPVCQRPFTWRKKWRHNWNEVVYCSKRCASRRSPASTSQ